MVSLPGGVYLTALKIVVFGIYAIANREGAWALVYEFWS